VTLHGTWLNALKSRLALEHDENGFLEGSYSTVDDQLAGKEHALVGFCDFDGALGAATIGFVVRWPSDHSVTVWSGRYSPASDEITTTWLLSYPGLAENSPEWRSTLVGHDTFVRSR